MPPLITPNPDFLPSNDRWSQYEREEGRDFRGTGRRGSKHRSCSRDGTVMKSTTQRRADDIFTQGYVCACANIILTHGADTVAKDVLRGAGRVNWKIIDEYDRDTLAKVGLAPRRRKTRSAASVGRGNEEQSAAPGKQQSKL